MSNPVTKTRRRTVNIHQGLVLIRLTADGDKPTAQFGVHVPEGATDSVSLVTNPQSPDNVLRKDGECLVLRCSKPCAVEIDAHPAEGSSKISGSLQIEYLTNPAVKRVAAPAAKVKASQTAGAAAPNPNTCFMAHIAQHGDWFFRLNDWIGCPTRSNPIEALSVRAGFDGLPKLMMRDCMTGQVVEPGKLLGTRGCNKPLRAIDIWIADSRSPMRLQAEALFRKAGHLRLIGERVSLVGDDDADALLGVRLALASPLLKRAGQTATSRVKIYSAH